MKYNMSHYQSSEFCVRVRPRFRKQLAKRLTYLRAGDGRFEEEEEEEEEEKVEKQEDVEMEEGYEEEEEEKFTH